MASCVIKEAKPKDINCLHTFLFSLIDSLFILKDFDFFKYETLTKKVSICPITVAVAAPLTPHF